MTHSRVRHDSLVCATWFTHVCDISPSHKEYASCICAMSHSFIRAMSHSFICDMAWVIHSYVTRHFQTRHVSTHMWYDTCMWYDTFTFDVTRSYVTCPIHMHHVSIMWDMTVICLMYVCQDRFISEAALGIRVNVSCECVIWMCMRPIACECVIWMCHIAYVWDLSHMKVSYHIWMNDHMWGMP